MTRRAHAGHALHALLACALTLAACHAAAPRAPGSPGVPAPAPAAAPAPGARAPGAAPAAPAPGARAPGAAPAAPAPGAAPAPASATPAAPSSPGATPAPPARLVVAVAELAGDPGQRVKKRVLAHLRAFAPGAATGPTPGLRPDLALEVLDVPQHVLADGAAASDDSPFAILQQGHDRARSLLTALRASALIWGTAGAAPVLYVTTADPADSLHSPCADPAAPVDADSPRSALCALESGATWLLCATAWAEIVPVGCAPAP